MSTIASRKKSIISASGVSIDQPVANNSLLNKAASESLYQQCSRLRARLLQIPEFARYFTLACPPETTRQSTDPVTQLWDCLALGVPLCVLYNLLPEVADKDNKEVPPIAIETDPDKFDVTNDKVKKRAIALFTMKAKAMFPTYELFNVTELLGTRETSDGFTKVSSASLYVSPDECLTVPILRRSSESCLLSSISSRPSLPQNQPTPWCRMTARHQPPPSLRKSAHVTTCSGRRLRPNGNTFRTLRSCRRVAGMITSGARS
jgi:hypothetical protein